MKRTGELTATTGIVMEYVSQTDSLLRQRSTFQVQKPSLSS